MILEGLYIFTSCNSGILHDVFDFSVGLVTVGNSVTIVGSVLVSGSSTAVSTSVSFVRLLGSHRINSFRASFSS